MAAAIYDTVHIGGLPPGRARERPDRIDLYGVISLQIQMDALIEVSSRKG